MFKLCVNCDTLHSNNSFSTCVITDITQYSLFSSFKLRYTKILVQLYLFMLFSFCALFIRNVKRISLL